MSILSVIGLTFGILVFVAVCIVVWATLYPKIQCKKTFFNADEYNVCIKTRGHIGSCKSASGQTLGKPK